MKIFNTLTRTKEEFVPLEEGKVKMYVCGPTVYNYIHIGNARPMIVFDTVRRYFEYKGYDVNYDLFVLAGVSLGFLQTTYPGWGKALLDHIEISLRLHKIVKVILLDHLDCGAYKTFCPGLKPEKEIEEHKNNLKMAKEKIQNLFPRLIVKTWILHLDGKLDCIKDKKN